MLISMWISREISGMGKMKPFRIFVVSIISLALGACISSPTQVMLKPTDTLIVSTQIPLRTPSPVPTLTPTHTAGPAPTPTLPPTSLPPTPTITPAVLSGVPFAPNALNPENVVRGLTRLNRIGRGRLYDVKWSPGGKRVAIALGDSVIVLDAQTREKIWRTEFANFSFAALGILQVDGKTVYAASVFAGDEASIFDLASGSVLQTFRSDGPTFTGLAFSSDRRTLAAIDEEARLTFWDLQTGERTHTFLLSEEAAAGPLRFDADGSSVLLLAKNKNIVIRFNLRNEAIQHHPYSGWQANTRLGYLPYRFLGNGDLLTWNQSQTGDTLTLRNLTSGENVVISRAVNDELDRLETAAHSADGEVFAAGAVEGQISIWRMDNLTEPQLLFGHEPRSGEGFTGTTIHLEFSPTNNLILSVGFDQTTRLWNIETGNFVRLLSVCCYAGFTPDGRLLVTAGDGVIRVWGVPPWP